MISRRQIIESQQRLSVESSNRQEGEEEEEEQFDEEEEEKLRLERRKRLQKINVESKSEKIISANHQQINNSRQQQTNISNSNNNKRVEAESKKKAAQVVGQSKKMASGIRQARTTTNATGGSKQQQFEQRKRQELNFKQQVGSQKPTNYELTASRFEEEEAADVSERNKVANSEQAAEQEFDFLYRLNSQRTELDEDEDEEEEVEDDEEELMRVEQLRAQDHFRHFDPYSVYGEEDEEEDVWYSEKRLFEDHIQEIIEKWFAIDDEIWAKIICMERNRRIAKAYARKQALTVNGSEDEYLDGTTLGLNLFDNPDRDTKTRHIKQYIGQGLRIKITQSGDILVKRLSKANVFVHKLSQNQLTAANSSNYSLGANDRSKSSSSDLYALHSESGGDLYGIVSPNSGNHLHNHSALGSFSNFNNRNLPQVGRHLDKQQQHAEHSKIMLHASSSDASTSSSSGVCAGASAKLFSSSNGSKTTSASSANHSSILLDYNREHRIFDMTKFKANLERESRLPYPNRRLLQNQCISIISFVVDDHKMLNLPSWIMIINIVAIDLLKIELGLVDRQHDYFMNNTHHQASSILCDPLGDQHRFSAAPSSGKSRLFSPDPRGHHAYQSAADSVHSSKSPMMIMNQQHQCRNGFSRNQQSNQLAASKKAFANAAAQGAYNGDLYANHRREMSIAKQQSNGGRLRRYNQGERSNYPLFNENDYEVQHHRRHDHDLEVDEEANGVHIKLNREVASGSITDSQQAVGKQTDLLEVQQQSSSSSGFNSHCSSQNNSSAASSSSNIAGSGAMSAASSGCEERDQVEVETEVASKSSSSPINVASIVAKANGKINQIKENGPTVSTEKISYKKGVASAVKAHINSYKHLAKGQQNRPTTTSANDQQSCDIMMSANQQESNHLTRGKRPPKLPHRVESSTSKPKMSEPIPIPAPPTGAGAGSSGKANLILVSPTGLSPPLPKRKGASTNAQLKARSKSQSELIGPQANSIGIGSCSGGNEVDMPEFDCIKHIDENGRCSVIHKVEPHLPAGIPAHAQLAPPATQRHILRYLMSAARTGKLRSKGPASDYQHSTHILAPPYRNQRPLPVLPGHKNQLINGCPNSRQNMSDSYEKQLQKDESLYYCGLQARVPIRTKPPPHMNPIMHHPVSKSAINAILTDFRRNANDQQNQPNPYFRSQYSLTNLQEARHVQPYNQQFCNPSSGGGTENICTTSSSSASTKRPLMKFFKSSVNNNKTSATTSSMFMSADNLHQTSQKSSPSSILNHIGIPLKLKRPKTKNLVS